MAADVVEVEGAFGADVGAGGADQEEAVDTGKTFLFRERAGQTGRLAGGTG